MTPGGHWQWAMSPRTEHEPGPHGFGSHGSMKAEEFKVGSHQHQLTVTVLDWTSLRNTDKIQDNKPCLKNKETEIKCFKTQNVLVTNHLQMQAPVLLLGLVERWLVVCGQHWEPEQWRSIC